MSMVSEALRNKETRADDWRNSWRSSRLGGECGPPLSPPRRQGRKVNAKEISLVAARLRWEHPYHPSEYASPVELPANQFVTVVTKRCT